MIKFKVKGHLASGQKQMVEVWLEKEGEKPVFVAGIYPLDEKGISVVSKYLEWNSDVEVDSKYPPKVRIPFNLLRAT